MYNQAMGNFNRGNRDNNRFGGRRDRPSMHKTTCSKCGNECEVPFIPTSGKPVFCSRCFEENGSSNSRSFGGRDSGRPRFGNKPMYEAVCDNCGNKCQVPFQPTSGKPIYCSRCFGDKNQKGGGNAPQYKEQFEALNAKLDKILKMLTPVVPAEDIKLEKPVKKAEKKKTTTKKVTSD